MSRRERLTTIVLMGAAAVTEKMDEGVLPSVFLAVGASLDVGPAELGTVALCRALAQAASSPLAGALGDSLDRTRVASAGCLLWAVATFLLATATSLRQMLPLAALNGVGLALALPALQSVVADAVPARSRGSAFGAVGLAAGFGGMLAAFAATAAARRRFFGGVEGWRCAFAAVAAVSFVVGVLSWLLAVDPRGETKAGQRGATSAPAALAFARERRRRRKQEEKLSDPGESNGNGREGEEEEELLPLTSTPISTSAPTTTAPPPPTPAPAPPPPPPPLRPSFPRILRRFLSDTLSALVVCFRVPSFRVIVGQGVLGSMPWNAMVHSTLLLQLLGFSDVSAGALAALFAATCALGNLLGGFIGDAAAKRTAKGGRNGSGSAVGGIGRVAVAQFSVAASIPLAVVLLGFLPHSGPCRCRETAGGGEVAVGGFFHREAGAAASSAIAACSPRSRGCTAAFAVLVALTGLFSSWCGANNSAIFAEIVPAELRSSVYAFDRSFEGAVGALATPLVGVVAVRVFGFKGGLAGSSSSSSSSSSPSPSALNLPQAKALASALIVCSVVPWALCLAAYTLLYRFYPLDAAAAAAAAAEASAAAAGGGGSERATATAAPTAPAADPASSSLELVEGSSFGGSRAERGAVARGASAPAPPPPPAAPPASTSSANSGSSLERGDGAGAPRDFEVASSSQVPNSSAGFFGSLSRRSLEPQRRR